jgi:hypothetical protein
MCCRLVSRFGCLGVLQAAVADSVDRTRLNGHDAVRLMQAEARLASHFEAGKLATMSEVAHSPGGSPGSPVERDIFRGRVRLR